MDRLQGVAEFVAVVEAGSFVKAAANLGMTKSGVGKAVSRLEERLGVRLLNRTTRSLSPTDDGRALYERGRRLLADLQEIEDGLSRSRGTPRGRLRVDLPTTLGHVVIVPTLARFLARYPELALEVRLNDRNVDLAEEGVDVAVRFGELPDSGLVAKRLGLVRFCTFASPEYLARRGEPRHPDELAGHDCLDFVYASGRAFRWRFASDGAEVAREVPARLACNSGEAVLLAAIAGAGVAQLLSYLPERAIGAGLLAPVLEDFVGPGLPLAVVYPTGRHLSPRVKAFVDHVTSVVRPFVADGHAAPGAQDRRPA
jgi:LysR family transcriptional regulator for bpeEF and oprC